MKSNTCIRKEITVHRVRLNLLCSPYCKNITAPKSFFPKKVIKQFIECLHVIQGPCVMFIATQTFELPIPYKFDVTIITSPQSYRLVMTKFDIHYILQLIYADKS